MLQRGGIVAKPMAAIHNNSGPRLHNSGRRIVVVAVPPVDELDLVGPLQVFNSVNRLAGRKIYEIEFVTNTNSPTVEGEGEGEVLTFVAKHHFTNVEGACDSVLLVCGVKSLPLKVTTSKTRTTSETKVFRRVPTFRALWMTRPSAGDGRAQLQAAEPVSRTILTHGGGDRPLEP
jgi:hypothetical protein